jgi:hypothetical protein
MADYMHASIAIGGRVTRDGAEALAEVMADDGLGYGADIVSAMLRGDDPRQVEDALYGWLEDGVLHAADDSVPWGEFDCVEAKCRELGLTYVRRSEGKYDILPEIVWSTGGTGLGHVLVDAVGCPLVHVARLKELLRDVDAQEPHGLDRSDLIKLRDGLRECIPVIPVVPPLEIVEGEQSR